MEEGSRDVSAMNSTCFCRGLVTSTHMAAQSRLSSQGIWCLLLISMGTRHAQGALTYERLGVRLRGRHGEFPRLLSPPPDLRQKPSSLKQKPCRLFFSHQQAPCWLTGSTSSKPGPGHVIRQLCYQSSILFLQTNRFFRDLKPLALKKRLDFPVFVEGLYLCVSVTCVSFLTPNKYLSSAADSVSSCLLCLRLFCCTLLHPDFPCLLILYLAENELNQDP